MNATDITGRTIDTATADNAPAHEATGRSMGQRGRRLVAAAAAAVGLVSGLGMTTASATSITQYPTFGCYKTASGATIQGDALKVNLDGRSTVYFAEVYRWNGSWVDIGHLYNSAGGANVAFQDTPFGELSEQPLTARVGHGYYQVVYFMGSTGDKTFQRTNALDLDAPSSRYDNLTCYV